MSAHETPFTRLPFYDTAPASFLICRGCNTVAEFCICPANPSEPAPVPKPKPSPIDGDRLRHLLADLNTAINLLASGSAKRWRNEAEEEGLKAAREIVKEMKAVVT